jgi:predicted DNA-binding ribbon-helix-helix protein
VPRGTPIGLRANLISLNTAAADSFMVGRNLWDGGIHPPRLTGETMNTANIKRSIVRNGQKTSVSLEDEFWEGLREIANAQKAKLSTLVRQIDQGRQGNNLSSAIRVFVFNQLRSQASAGGYAVVQQAAESAEMRG